MSSFWSWFTGLFTSLNKKKIQKVIDDVQNFVEKATPIVILIDEKLKPAIQNDDKVKILFEFIRANSSSIDNALDIAENLIKLPTPEMWASLAVELLKSQVTINVSLSVLRLAVELAYSIYKASKNDE